jgi:hypothetical protein
VPLDFTNRDGLLAAMADWLNRQDLTDQLPGFVQLFEAEANRELRVRDMQTTFDGTTSGDTISVPADFLEPYSLRLAAGTGGYGPELEFISEGEANKRLAENAYWSTTGTPAAYTIFGSSFELLPPPDANTPYRLKYLAKVPALTTTATSNWLLLKAPDLYLYGSLLHAAPYLKNDERLATWAGLRQQIMDKMQIESDRATKPQSKLNAKPRSF